MAKHKELNNNQSFWVSGTTRTTGDIGFSNYLPYEIGTGEYLYFVKLKLVLSQGSQQFKMSRWTVPIFRWSFQLNYFYWQIQNGRLFVTTMTFLQNPNSHCTECIWKIINICILTSQSLLLTRQISPKVSISLGISPVYVSTETNDTDNFQLTTGDDSLLLHGVLCENGW